MKTVNIGVTLSLFDSAGKPSTGNVRFEFEAPNLPAGMTVEKSGNIDIEGLPDTDRVELKFHVVTKQMSVGGKDYRFKFIPSVTGTQPADSRELLRIGKGDSKPSQVWNGGDGFRTFAHNVHEEDSSMSVVVDKAKLAKGTYTYDLALNSKVAGSPGVGEMVRHDPQIRNGSPPTRPGSWVIPATVLTSKLTLLALIVFPDYRLAIASIVAVDLVMSAVLLRHHWIRANGDQSAD